MISEQGASGTGMGEGFRFQRKLRGREYFVRNWRRI